jgi:hypothetical protein
LYAVEFEWRQFCNLPIPGKLKTCRHMGYNQPVRQEGTPMTYPDLQAFTKPFRPFRIVTANNEVFDIWQREGFILTAGYIDIGLLKSGTDEYERVTWVDLALIARVEPLVAAPQVKGGQPS